MDAKFRIVMAVTMTAVMVLMVTLVSTLVNLGPRADFFVQWAKAYIVAWPVAAVTGFLMMPPAQRVTRRILGRSDGRP